MKKPCISILFLPIAALCFLSSCQETSIDSSPAPHKDASNSTLKKGIGISRYNDGTEASGKRINDLNVGWYYNWGITNPSADFVQAEYVPMVWGASSVNASNLALIKQRYEDGIYHHLLTFNEPDIKDQSNLSVEQAIALWPQLEAIGIPLSSPCPAFYDSSKEDGWLDRFMQKAQELHYRVDFIAVHCYQDFSTPGAEKLLKRDVLDPLYERYHLPIWLTEFGAIDTAAWSGGKNEKCTEKAAKQYIENCTKMLESVGYVERYAWFLDNFMETGDARPKEAPYTSLYQDDNTISSTGKIYRDTVSHPALYIEDSSIPFTSKGEKFEYKMQASGGNGTYLFSAEGLPEGLSITNSGIIYGKAKTSGYYTIKISVMDEAKQTTYKKYNYQVL